MPTLQDLTERVREVASSRGTGGRPVTLDLGETGIIRIEGDTVENAEAPSECRVSLSDQDLEALIEGRLDPTLAYMTGQLRVEGDMNLALQLAQALRGS